MKDNWVFGVGPSNAKLMIIGEAPGKYEEERKIPFVGPTGELLTEMLENAGIRRSECYLTNVVKIRPPKNDLSRLHEIPNEDAPLVDYPDGDKIVTAHEGYKIQDFLPLLWEEIKVMQPNCILACGSLAFETLTGLEGIKNYRGSILQCLNFPIKVIPTIHPAALFERNRGKSSGQGMFTWKQKVHIQFDVFKAARESKFPDFSSIPVRDLRIIRNSLQLEQFFHTYESLGYEKVWVDTEVFKAHLVCIGFAFTPTEGVSIPLIDLQSNSNPNGIPLHDMLEIWKIISYKLSTLKVIGQNFKADKVYWLEPAGFEKINFVHDAMFKMHTLSPELPKGLAFQASILTNEPYWKSEGKEYNPWKDKLDVLLKYNAKDCCVNCECDLAMDEDLKEFGLEDFFYNFVMKLYPVYEKIEKRGMKVNKEKVKELNDYYDNLLKEESDKRVKLMAEFGIEYEYNKKYGTSDVNYNSPPQVSELIYVRLRCPIREDTRDETLTALMNNAVRDSRKREIINSILTSRSLYKLKETYVNARIDPDGRMRYSYNQVGTETGRTSTSVIKKPLRNGEWGVAIQTTPRPDEFGGKIREMYIPDEGKVLIEFDQSQAEARIVALLANDLNLLALYDKADVHKLTAAFVYNVTDGRPGDELVKAALGGEQLSFLEFIDDFQRQIGKSSRHGLAYKLSPDGLSIKMKISLYRAKQAFAKVHEMSPNIQGVFHEEIEAKLAESRVWWTPFGRRREFFEQWGEKLFREACAHIPQSTIGDNTKRMLLGIADVDWIEILEEGHDSFLAQIPIGREKECRDIVKPIFEQEIDFERCTIKRPPITIPTDCKVGFSWGTMEKVVQKDSKVLVKRKDQPLIEVGEWTREEYEKIKKEKEEKEKLENMSISRT